MDFRFLDFCRHDTLFYDAPDPVADEHDFDVRPHLGAGWTATRGREWTVCAPADLVLPDQGWKVHVSALPDDAARQLNVVAPYCVARGLMFKFINSREIVTRRGSKYGDRSASGKAITIYPPDEEELERTLRELDDLVGGTPAPYVLSDLRFRRGPLFVRYGGFSLRLARAEDGALVPGIEDPQGRLVPDERKPVFRPPAWVTVPGFLEESLAARNSGTLVDFPYRVQRALHFSNGGGVYRAVDTRDGSDVLLKEARPMAGLDASGVDAVARMQREHWALEQLAGLPSVPALIDYRHGHEHQFLAREFVDGVPLVDLLDSRHPFATGDRSEHARATYVEWAVDILEQVEQGIADLHERGVVFGDLHPGNILVRPDGRIAFIDLETATPVEAAYTQSMGALGFYAPGHLSGPDVDRYALAVLRLTMFAPLPQVVPWGRGKLRELANLARDYFVLPDGTAQRLAEGLGPDLVPDGPDYSVPWPVDDPALGQDLAASILAVATPERDDRLYPGDPQQYLTPAGTLTLAHGAAGVIWALQAAGHDVPEAHVDWLVARLGGLATAGPGFYDGLAGVADALDAAGRDAEAEQLVGRALATAADETTAGLADGWSGLGLTLLGMAGRRADGSYVEAARSLLPRLGEPVRPRAPGRIGLLHGRAGVALFLLELFRSTGERTHLDAAVTELRADLERVFPDGPEEVAVPPGLAGSAGLALVISAVLQEAPLADLARAHRLLLGRIRGQLAIPGGLFKGRAGAIQALLGGLDANDPDLRAQLQALGWEAVAPQTGQVHVLGDRGHRLSTDLATGSAGVLLALTAARRAAGPLLPYLSGLVPSPAQEGAA